MTRRHKIVLLAALYLAQGLPYGFFTQALPVLLRDAGYSLKAISATSLLFLMMRKGEASKVASLFYLIPGTTALMGFAVLGETLGATTLLGFTVTAGAVHVCTRKPA